MVKGFTLPELLVSLAILSIVTAVATPSLSDMIEKNKVSTDVLTVKTLISTTRSKAITDKTYLVICGQIEDSSCNRNWSTLSVLAKDSKALIYRSKLSGNYASVTWSAFQNKKALTFAPTGFTHHQNGTLYLCHESNDKLHRAVVVSKSGRTTIKSDTRKLLDRCSSNN
ncbi:GspH/FimT family pseudopilin [Kangiella marina]|uniref:GspH/FimT family pseudopilin n=1 Tax=Kangiella marina TaxID=1079178 RepID=UPI0031ED3789